MCAGERDKMPVRVESACIFDFKTTKGIALKKAKKNRETRKKVKNQARCKRKTE
jgi:hypothetical protein